MRFPRTLPKAFLILLLVFSFLFVGAAPVQADITLGDVLEGFGDFLLGGPIGVVIGQFTGFHVSSIVGGAVGGLAATIAKALASLASTLIFIITIAFFAVAGSLIGTALEFNSKISLIAETGYNITLGVANMGFIVALVVIAFATMLRQEGFGYKKALPRVIIAALLINFGFFIVTQWLIAPVNQVTEAIESATSLDVDSLAKVFSISNLFEQFTSFSEFKNVGGAFGEIGKAAASVFAAAAFSFIGIISLFAFAIMLFIRGIALGLLIILLPLAWIAWIFPNLKLPGGINPWQEWWQSFTRWLLFAPFAMFFLWLSIQLANQGGLFPDPDKNLYSAIGQMIVTSGLILGGLLVSNRMGIVGSGYALAAASKGKVWAQRLAKERIGLVKDKTSRKLLESKAIDERATKMAALGGLRGFMGRRTIMAKATARKGVEEAIKKKYANLAPYEKVAIYDGLSETDRKVLGPDITASNFQWEGTEKFRTDIARWYKAGNVFPHSRKFMNDLIERGLDPAVVAAEEDLYEGLRTHTPEIFEQMEKTARWINPETDKRVKDHKELRGIMLGLEEEAGKESGAVQKLINAKDEAHKEMGRVLGSKGYPQTDARLMGNPGEFKPLGPASAPLRSTLYRTHFTEGFMDVAPGALNARLSSGRGSNIPVITGAVEGKIEDIDQEIIGRLAGSIESAIIASDKSPESKEAEIRRLKDPSLATASDRNSWIQQNWAELLKLERADPQEFRRTGKLIKQGQQQLAASINQLFVTGKRAFIMPFFTPEGLASTPPPA